MMKTDENIPSKEKSSVKEEQKKLEINEAEMRTAMSKLNDTSPEEVLKALSYIRINILETNNDLRLFHECGGFKDLFRALSSSHNEVLNDTLSILENYCTKDVINEEFCNEVIHSSVASKLLTILNNNIDTTIQKRLCRLVGNLAQSSTIAQDLHRVAFPEALVLLLDSTQDIDVQQMAIRALRWMWKSEEHQSEMLKLGIIKTVSSFLDAENEQLLKVVLRSLIVFIKSCKDEVAKQLTEKEYSTLVSKLGTVPAIRVLICNLSQCSFARVELNKAGIVASIVRLIQASGEDKLDYYLITSLCYMCRESMVRDSLSNNEDGYKTLVSPLMNPSAKDLYPKVLCAITQFTYNEIMIMVKGGLLNVLFIHLREYTKEYGLKHTKVTQDAASIFNPFMRRLSLSNVLNAALEYSIDQQKAELLFSPECDPSDSEEDSPPPPPPPEPRFVICKTEDRCERWLVCESSRLDRCILEILFQLSYMRVPLTTDVINVRTAVDILLEYLISTCYCKKRMEFVKVATALYGIVIYKDYFHILLEEECILDIHRVLCRPIHANCLQCMRLGDTGRYLLQEYADLAHSCLGEEAEEEMTNSLASSAHTVSVTIALSVPYFIWQPDLLKSLLFGHRALLRCLLETLSTMLEEAVLSLRYLFQRFEVEYSQTPEQVCTSCEISLKCYETNVTFVTDDGCRVDAQRETLEHACPVFEAMFRGGFMESNLSQVNLEEITADCLQHLTRLIASEEFCSCLLPTDINTLLELVQQTDRFLLPDLTKKVFSHIMNNRLCAETSPQIFKWGVTIGRHLPVADNVPHDVIRYLLSDDHMSKASRQLAIDEIIKSEHKEVFLNEMMEVVEEDLTTYSIDHYRRRMTCTFLYY